MAIELCSEKSSAMGITSSSSNNTTPRISFSYDFLQSDVVPIEQRPLRSNPSGLNSSIDFDFCVRQVGFDQESSSADELFSDGKILPTEIKKKLTSSAAAAPAPAPATASTKQFLAPQETAQSADNNGNNVSITNPKVVKKESSSSEPSKSFWRFKRSSSCGSGGYGRTLCPLPLLSRSNSTGSADETKPINMKRTPLPKETSRQGNGGGNANPQRYSSQSYQKPPLKKSLGAYGNGVTINPVLNVPPANLFAVGSIFSNGKNKSKKK